MSEFNQEVSQCLPETAAVVRNICGTSQRCWCCSTEELNLPHISRGLLGSVLQSGLFCWQREANSLFVAAYLMQASLKQLYFSVVDFLFNFLGSFPLRSCFNDLLWFGRLLQPCDFTFFTTLSGNFGFCNVTFFQGWDYFLDWRLKQVSDMISTTGSWRLRIL